MKNFIFKSDADFHKILFNKLDIISGNILYITHMQDKILKLVKELDLDSRLQKQVTDFLPLEDNMKDIPDSEDGS